MNDTIGNTMRYILSLDRYFTAGDTSSATLAILLDLGFSVHCDGFSHLRLAISRKHACPHLRCQDIYEEVAQKYGCAANAVQIEQAVRSAISSAWSAGPQEQWDLLFPPGKDGRRKKPANFEFIARIACILELWTGCRKIPE